MTYDEVKAKALERVAITLEGSNLLPSPYTMADLKRIVNPIYGKEFDQIFLADLGIGGECEKV